MKSNTEICKKLRRLFSNEPMFLLGKRVYDVCDHKLRSNTRTNFATLTKDECLHTCQNRDITGCESRTNRKFNTECFFHTKGLPEAAVSARSAKSNLRKYPSVKFPPTYSSV